MPETLYYQQFFRRDTLLSRDTLLFRDGPANATSTVGHRPLLMPESLHRNDIVTGSTLICLAMVMMIFRATKRSLPQRFKDFMYPTRSKNSDDADSSYNSSITNLCLALLTALLTALLFFCYAQTRYNIDIISVTPIELLGIYVAVTLTIITTKALMYAFVHSVFFSRQQRAAWLKDFSLIFLVQTAMLLPLTLIAVYFNFSAKNTAIALAIVLLFVKIPLLLKAYSTFFVKSYGYLHLIVYFCALEAAPIVAMWAVLTQITDILQQY